jgi:hypothetical protein
MTLEPQQQASTYDFKSRNHNFILISIDLDGRAPLKMPRYGYFGIGLLAATFRHRLIFGVRTGQTKFARTRMRV